MQEIIIDPEISSINPPLTPDEFSQLEANCLADGIRDPLVLWGNTLVDGHNRYALAKKHGLEYQIVKKLFPSREAVIEWMIRLQFGRRNLTDLQRISLAEKLRPIIEAKAKENLKTHTENGYKQPCQKFDNPGIDTKKELARAAQVSHDTYSKGKKILDNGSSELINAVKSGAVKSISSAAEITELPKQVQTEIVAKGEKEILRAAKEIRAEKIQNRKDLQVKKESQSLNAPVLGLEFKILEESDPIKCDAIITDPPYGILDEDWEPKDLESFTREWLQKWNLSGADFILSFFCQRYLWNFRNWADSELKDYSFTQLLIWNYPNNVKAQNQTMFKQTYEPIFFYRRKDSNKKILVGAGEWGDGIHTFDCFTSVTPQSNFTGENMKQHPAQKDISVMKWLVNAASSPGDLIVDPFCGSGTTGIAACKLKRRFVGLEINPEYRILSEKRIKTYGI